MVIPSTRAHDTQAPLAHVVYHDHKNRSGFLFFDYSFGYGVRMAGTGKLAALTLPGSTGRYGIRIIFPMTVCASKRRCASAAASRGRVLSLSGRGWQIRRA